MRVYLDTSVVLRVLLREPGQIAGWGKWSWACSSRVWHVEALRTAERLRRLGSITDRQVADLRRDIDLVNDTLHIVPVTDRILQRAAESFPTIIGTLDAIHLATALAVRASAALDRLLTHDAQLATAAQAVGLAVDGV